MILVETALKPPEELDTSDFGNPARLAWGVLLIMFAVFCLLCAGVTLGTHYFFFRSSVNLDTFLQVGSGTIGVREGSSAEQTETDTRWLDANTTIRTDQTNALSQATITFRDPTFENRLIAAITLRGDTLVRFAGAQRPRFDFTSGIYRIEMDNVQGEIDVTVAQNLERDIIITLNSPQEAEARILESGRYVFEASLSQVALTNREGVGILIGPDPISPKAVPVNERGSYIVELNEIVSEPAFVNLLENSSLRTFQPDASAMENDEFEDIAIGWQCSANFQNFNEVPLGNFEVGFSPDGRRSFRLVRKDAYSNVATGCSQSLGTNSQDISTYNQLWLQATLYVDSQSLSACGSAASECPLMMRIRFEDKSGNDREWFHGVYTRIDPAFNWPLRCSSCRQDHYRIYGDAWYTYNSGNLFDVFPPNERPVRIHEVAFYASGHNYDVYVNEVALLARYAPESAAPIPENDAS